MGGPAPKGPRDVATGEAQRNPWKGSRCPDPAPAGAEEMRRLTR